MNKTFSNQKVSIILQDLNTSNCLHIDKQNSVLNTIFEYLNKECENITVISTKERISEILEYSYDIDLSIEVIEYNEIRKRELKDNLFDSSIVIIDGFLKDLNNITSNTFKNVQHIRDICEKLILVDNIGEMYLTKSNLTTILALQEKLELIETTNWNDLLLEYTTILNNNKHIDNITTNYWLTQNSNTQIEVSNSKSNSVRDTANKEVEENLVVEQVNTEVSENEQEEIEEVVWLKEENFTVFDTTLREVDIELINSIYRDLINIFSYFTWSDLYCVMLVVDFEAFEDNKPLFSIKYNRTFDLPNISNYDHALYYKWNHQVWAGLDDIYFCEVYTKYKEWIMNTDENCMRDQYYKCIIELGKQIKASNILTNDFEDDVLIVIDEYFHNPQLAKYTVDINGEDSSKEFLNYMQIFDEVDKLNLLSLMLFDERKKEKEAEHLFFINLLTNSNVLTDTDVPEEIISDISYEPEALNATKENTFNTNIELPRTSTTIKYNLLSFVISIFYFVILTSFHNDIYNYIYEKLSLRIENDERLIAITISLLTIVVFLFTLFLLRLFYYFSLLLIKANVTKIRTYLYFHDSLYYNFGPITYRIVALFVIPILYIKYTENLTSLDYYINYLMAIAVLFLPLLVYPFKQSKFIVNGEKVFLYKKVETINLSNGKKGILYACDLDDFSKFYFKSGLKQSKTITVINNRTDYTSIKKILGVNNNNFNQKLNIKSKFKFSDIFKSIFLIGINLIVDVIIIATVCGINIQNVEKYSYTDNSLDYYIFQTIIFLFIFIIIFITARLKQFLVKKLKEILNISSNLYKYIYLPIIIILIPIILSLLTSNKSLDNEIIMYFLYIFVFYRFYLVGDTNVTLKFGYYDKSSKTYIYPKLEKTFYLKTKLDLEVIVNPNNPIDIFSYYNIYNEKIRNSYKIDIYSFRFENKLYCYIIEDDALETYFETDEYTLTEELREFDTRTKNNMDTSLN